MRRILFFGYLAASVLSAQTARHNLTLDDLQKMQNVSDPRVSPDGQWVAYVVTTTDVANDKHVGNIWMASWDGAQEVQVTYSPESESSPRWSPDNRYLSFTSARPGKAKGSQVWVIDRRGGEARQFTAIPETEKLISYEWAPDGKRLALVLRKADEPPPDPSGKPAQPKPLVIDRYQFKTDEDGYLAGNHFSQVYLYDIDSSKYDRVTDFIHGDESDPVFSKDGSRIAFVSNQDAEPDRSEHTDVWVADARAHSKPVKISSFPGTNGGRPAWSPDGTQIAFLQGTEPKFTAYNVNRLAIAPASGSGPVRLLGESLDRSVSDLTFTPDGKAVTALVADDMTNYPARFPLDGSRPERLIGGKFTAESLAGDGGHQAMLITNDEMPPEVYALEGGAMRKLTHRNDSLMASISLGAVEEISFKSADGTEIHGTLTLPPGYSGSSKLPTLLRIHGGPNLQESHSFYAYAVDHQVFAASGYAVIAINYRGSAGRGRKFSETIFADWGHREVEDLMAGVDAMVKRGVADPDRLGIGGWSYGGILTDYTIANTNRFKAAISGAGSANQISMYGGDQYVIQYDLEVGPPWKAEQAWVKISYPFFHADRIHTPTLFLGGDQDFNVPLIGGEQMYQALKTLKIPTELIVYPGQHHGINRPSFQKDRFERYLAWYARYLQPSAKTSPSGE